jgi:metallophosphoesterase superfamily enzyme
MNSRRMQINNGNHDIYESEILEGNRDFEKEPTRSLGKQKLISQIKLQFKATAID